MLPDDPKMDASLDRLLEAVRNAPPMTLQYGPRFNKLTVCERVFAWRPVTLQDGRRWWLRNAYRVTTCEATAEGDAWSTIYTLTIPDDAL